MSSEIIYSYANTHAELVVSETFYDDAHEVTFEVVGDDTHTVRLPMDEAAKLMAALSAVA
jgi:hypothetical protein